MSRLASLVVRLGADTSELRAAFQSVRASTAKLSTDLKSVGKALTRNVTAPMAAAAVAIGGVAVKTADYADRVDKLSQRLGLSRDAFQQWDFVLSQNGVNIESMQMGMKTLAQRVDEANRSVGEGGDLFARLGVSVKDSSGAIKSQEELFLETVRSLQSMEEGVTKAALAQKLFGRNGQELLPMLNQSKGSIDELMQKARDLGLVMSGDAVDAGVQFTDTLDQVKRQLAAAAMSAGSSLLPVLQNDLLPAIQNHLVPAIRSMSEKLAGLVQWFGDLEPGAKKVAVVLAGVAFAAGPVLGALGGLVSLAPILAAGFAALTGPIGLTVLGLGVMAKAVYDNWQAIREFSAGVVVAARKMAVDLVGSLRRATDEVQSFLEALGYISPGARSTANALEALSMRLGDTEKAAEIDLSRAVNELDRVRSASVSANRALADFLARSVDPLGDGLLTPLVGQGGSRPRPVVDPVTTVTPTPGSTGGSGGSAAAEVRTMAEVLKDMRENLGRVGGDVELGLVRPLDAAAARAQILAAAISEARSLGASTSQLSGVARELAQARSEADGFALSTSTIKEWARTFQGFAKPIADRIRATLSPVETSFSRSRRLASELGSVLEDVSFEGVEVSSSRMAVLLAQIGQGAREAGDAFREGIGGALRSAVESGAGALLGSIGIGMADTRDRIAEIQSLLSGGDLGAERTAELREEMGRLKNTLNPVKAAWKSFGDLVSNVLSQLLADLTLAIAKALVLAGIKALIGGATGGVGGVVVGAVGAAAGGGVSAAAQGFRGNASSFSSAAISRSRVTPTGDIVIPAASLYTSRNRFASSSAFDGDGSYG